MIDRMTDVELVCGSVGSKGGFREEVGFQLLLNAIFRKAYRGLTD